ncbi:glycerophosphodiester phosphodiesterase GDPDL3-like [Humulus lupulus]|uniref:glycerophosphodiester phosphodiesterase GDPDL3-like n=1 Tax=Humulus lupulus TaxID=3486 RepID=UPI002B408FA4|nr:glycerophosphodiester phosphodiesterase GDPDL3-like [Humulus lupulus]
MCDSRALVSVALLFSLVAASVSAQKSSPKSPWQTLSGDSPLVIAHGGFSGTLPGYSYVAYSLALITSLPNVVLWCDVQLTKDAAGICASDVKLDNGTDIAYVFNKRDKEYVIDGKSTRGWFSVDFTLKELATVSISQGIYSRSPRFDGNLFQILTVDEMAKQLKPPGIWLNIQHDAFFKQQNLSMRNYVLSLSKRVVINYISSTELGFLNSIRARLNTNVTKLVFRFLGQDEIEPSTNQTYGSLMKNLTRIKTFASGIIVPKDYIWPIDTKSYLEPHTSLVSDAHKEGLEIYASEFASDIPLSYNYSYDPVAEYLNFIDNGDFSVDGVLTDFPITPSAAIDCFAHLGKNATEQAKPLVISKCGASGDYPGCTDKAYSKAIDDGVDVVDCPVQMSKDGIPFCLSSINLIDSTDVAQSDFSNLTTSIPQIKAGIGIFAFNMTWDQIQTLKPIISSPYSSLTLYRNPRNMNDGNFVSLSDFLAMTKKSSSLTGILISIEHAAYLAKEQGLSVTEAVISSLSEANFNNQTALKVMIQSTNSSVLSKFLGKNNYELVYKIEEKIRSLDDGSLKDIKSFADSVVVDKASVFPDTKLFLTGSTDVVSKLQTKNLSVYVETFSNEFVSQAWDFFSDATVEINSYVMGASIDGVITDFPKTAARYKRNRCLGLGDNTPVYMSPAQPGSLIQLISPPDMPPSEAPNPVLTLDDVLEPPLPPVSPTSSVSTPNSTAVAPTSRNAQPMIAAGSFLLSLAMLLSALLLF